MSKKKLTKKEAEKLKYETFYATPNEENEKEEFCPNGYAIDECDGEGMAGIESCEFCCPWDKAK